MQSKRIYTGIDIGASRTKVAVLDTDRNFIGRAVMHSGTDFGSTAELCLETALKMADASRQDIVKTISTGYGRKNVSFSNDTKTDIGGQDNKIIKIDKNGRRLNFKMNRKCAAGTGAFLEEMSMRLNIPLEDMNDLASQSTEMVKLGSYCTVFSATEVLESIRHGKKVPDIVKGLFYSVIKRVLEMDSLTENVVMTGGVVAHNPYLVSMTEEIIGRKILVPEYPQFTGALGAALFAMQE
jgi:activator of 2-hydroxyglutaryl-CoA dehydratase